MLDRFESLEAVSSLPFEVVANDKRILIWPDAFGRRPSVLAIAKRMAAEAYSVLLSKPFSCTAKAPVFEDPSKFDFANRRPRQAWSADGTTQR